MPSAFRTTEQAANLAAKQAGGNVAEKEFARKLLMRPDVAEMYASALGNKGAAERMGVRLTLPEMLGQTEYDPLLAMQKKLVTSDSTTGDVQKLMQQRMGGLGETGQIANAIDQVSGNLGYRDIDSALRMVQQEAGKGGNEITAALTKEASPLYNAALSKEVPTTSLDALAAFDPVVARYLQKAVEAKDPSLLYQTYGKSQESVSVLDAAKKLIDKDLNNMGSNPPADPAALARAKENLVSFTDRFASEYPAARDVYTSRPQELAQRELLGRLNDVDPLKREQELTRLFRQTPETVKMTADALGEDGSRAAAAAYLNNVRNSLKQGNLPPKVDNQTIQNLKAYAGTGAEQEIDDLFRTIENVRKGNRYLAGSQTTPLRDINDTMALDAANAAIDVVSGGKTSLLRKGASMVGDMLKRGNEEKYNKDLWDLFNSPRGLELVREAMEKQKTALEMPSGGALRRVASENVAMGASGGNNTDDFVGSYPQAAPLADHGMPPAGYVPVQRPEAPPAGYVLMKRNK
jgi:hypothetical protein